MLNAVLVLVGAVSAWLVIDYLMSRRRHAAWSDVSTNRSFHSTGWEETIAPPLNAVEPPLPMPRQLARTRSAPGSE